MASRSAIRVGIIVTLAAVALYLVLRFLGTWPSKDRYIVTAVFDDAQGIPKGAAVTMAGVPIGQVKDVNLDKDQRAVMQLQLNTKYPIPDGSLFTLSVGVLISDKSVFVIPNRHATSFIPDGAHVRGVTPTRIEDLLPKANKLVANLTEVSVNLKDLLGDPKLKKRMDNAFANLENASARLDKTMGLIQTAVKDQQEQIDILVRNAVTASGNLLSISKELERFVKHGGLQENIKATMTAARETAESIKRTAKSLEQFVTDPEVHGDLKGILSSTRETSESLSRTAQSLEKFATDPKLQEDVRETASGARQAVGEAQKVLSRVNRVIGGGKSGDMPKLKISLPTFRDTHADAIYRPDDNRFRLDASTKLSLKHDFVELGIYDLGGGSKAILEPGRALSPTTDFRYGLYASRLGIGLDHRFSGRSFGTADLYDSFRPKLDVKLGFMLGDDLGLLVGADKLFGENQITVGARFTR